MRPESPAGPGLSLSLPAEALRPLVAEVVAEVLAHLEADRAHLDDGHLCYSEEEAARLLGLRPHVLRDTRRRGEIVASQIVGRRIRYTRDDLLRYLAERRVEASDGDPKPARGSDRRHAG
jgi:hypothetical protein